MPKSLISNYLCILPFGFSIIEVFTYIDEVIDNRGCSDNIYQSFIRVALKVFSFSNTTIHCHFHLVEKCTQWQPWFVCKWVEFTIGFTYCFEGVFPSIVLHLIISFQSTGSKNAYSVGVHIIDTSFVVRVQQR